MGFVPPPAARGSGTRVRGAVSSQDVARPAVRPRYFPNFRPPCRTRKSIRPAPCRVSDRTMVRLARTATLGIRPVRIRQASQGDKGTMKKKTAQPRRKQRKTSVSEKKKGLIAQKKTTGSSERAKSALDNRSHRTRCSPGQQSCRGTSPTLGPLAEPEKALGRLRAESQIEPWFASRDRNAWYSSSSDPSSLSRPQGNDEKEDCPTPTQAPQDLGVGEEKRADCPEKNSWVIRKGEVCS